MTKIPPEHTAAKSLENAFRVLGEERARARPGRRRPFPSTRVALAAATSVLVAAGVATGTKVFTGEGDAVDSDPTGLTGRIQPSLGYRRLAEARATDPGDAEPWGLRMFTSAKGETCLTLGRVVGGRLGVLADGQFQELPARAGGMCAPLDAHHIVMAVRDYYAASRDRHRTVLYGAADRTVRTVDVVSTQGRTTPVPIAADGTFIVVRGGDRPFHLARLVVDGAGGRRVRPLGP